MNVRTQHNLMSQTEREKVEEGPKVDTHERDGLLGQFPEITAAFKARTASMKNLFAEAEENIITILGSECFSGFQDYMRNKKADSLVAHDLSEIINGKVKASKYIRIWSALQYNNRNFELILHEGKLELCICEYVHQNEHIHSGVRWHRVIGKEYRLECDSYRLHQILTILANPVAAWTYLRARVYAREFFANNPQY